MTSFVLHMYRLQKKKIDTFAKKKNCCFFVPRTFAADASSSMNFIRFLRNHNLFA